MSSFQMARILGIDYGHKVIGLSTYAFNIDPYPLLYGRIIVESESKTLNEIQRICTDEFIDTIVLGLPFLTDGQESSMTKKVRLFGETLKKELGHVKLFYQDETLTTYEAQERMKNDPSFNFTVDPQRIDEVSAAIIIESFLNERN